MTLIRRVLCWRIFWYSFLLEKEDGYLYDVWSNWITGDQYEIFSGYGWGKGLRKKSTTFNEAIIKFNGKD